MGIARYQNQCQIMVEAVMYFYTLYLLTLLTQVTSSIMMSSSSEPRLVVYSVSCPKIADLVCSIDSDSVSQDDLNSHDIPCPPPHHFMEFCDTSVGGALTCKIKLYVMQYCYRKYSHMYLAKVCVNCSCDYRCNDVTAFMIQKRFLENTSYQAYSSTTPESRSTTFSFAISASTTDLNKVSTGISVTENVTDILLPRINSTSSDSTNLIMTTLVSKMQFTNRQHIALDYFIILPAIIIIEVVVLILIFRYRRKYRQRHTISSNRPEEDADPNICRLSSTLIEPGQVPAVYNVPMDNPVYNGSNSLESESDRNIFQDYDKWRYIDDSRSVSSM